MVYNYVRLESSTAEISVDLVMVLHLLRGFHFTQKSPSSSYWRCTHIMLLNVDSRVALQLLWTEQFVMSRRTL